ncbi:MAG: penicillin-binding protein [Acidimicrobiales bacterium]|nr:penicillin-binding protein [Acidimicrobiales bacterium]
MRRAGVAVAAILAAAGVVIVGVHVLRRTSSLPTSEARTFLGTWSRFDGGAAGRLTTDPTAAAAAVTGMRDGLRVDTASFNAGRARRVSGGAEVAYTADLDVGGLGPWKYSGVLKFVRQHNRWVVAWSPATLQPALGADQHLARRRTWPARAQVLAADGAPLTSSVDVIAVGIEPDRVKDRAQTLAALQQQLAVDVAKLSAALDRPGLKPNAFVPVTTLAADRYQQVRPTLAPVPGVVFQRHASRVAVTPELGAHVVGRVGDVTAERLKALGPPYQAGDIVGLSGLESAFERQLAGRPSGEVDAVDGQGRTARVLIAFTGADPQPLKTTLLLGAQRSAEAALAGVAKPAAIVAVDAATGAVRAVVSTPVDQAFNRALAGRYPPGSTFKVVTSAALLGRGLTVDAPATCPPKRTVGGLTFSNFEGEAPGSIPFHEAFAISCNTAFVGLASSLPSSALTAAAQSFGFGERYSLPLPDAGGQFPTPADDAERAAAAIGQGRVLASPLHMATVAAAVASGAWRPPTLVDDGTSSVAMPPLASPVVDALRQLMLEVVRSGTGTPAAVPGQAVAGKTGTAEFGGGTPPATHAWFIGFRGSLAFSVLVEGGGVGGRVAAPIAARFLSGIR